MQINGLVSTWRAGTAVITATSSRGFTLSYELTVTPTDAVRMEAWIGEAESELWITEAPEGVTIARSSDGDCDFDELASCANGEEDPASEDLITDAALTVNRDAYLSISNGTLSARTEIGTDRWSDREKTALAVFDDRMWLIGGGAIGDTSSKSDVWSTRDGRNWVQVTESAEFSGRRNHAAAAFDGRLWVVGGFDGSTALNDIWSSADGVNWQQVTASAPFSARDGHSLVAYNDALWLIGGDGFGDVWRSSDGESWTEVSDVLPGRGFNDAFVFNGELMFVATVLETNRVWKSADGEVWEAQEGAQPPSVSWGSYTVHDNKIWVMGGAFGGMQDRVWVSFDGIDYYAVPQVEDKGYRARYFAAAISFNNRLWLMSGNTSVGSVNDVVSSTDGATWMHHNFGSLYEGRSLQELADLNGRLYVLGGVSPTGQSSVWSTTDGLNWDEETEHAGFGERANHQVLSFGGKLWVLGGDNYYTGTELSDIWSSENGRDWVEEDANAAFGTRSHMRVVEWNGELWMVGGQDIEGTLYADVWRSADGVNWESVATNAGFPARQGHGLAVLNGQLCVFGGINSELNGLNDVWVSSDGVNWNQQTVTAPFPAGYANKSTAYAGRLVLLTNSEELWTSTDGTSWVNNGTSDSLPENAYGSSFAVWGNYLWLRASGWSRFRGNYDNAIYRSDNGLDWKLGTAITAEVSE